MKCEEVQNKIDMAFRQSSINIESETLAHIKGCRECGAYYNELVRLRDLLNTESFQALPGELDDITFENIVKSPRPEIKKAGILESIFPVKWLWAPAAAAAVIILFVIFNRTADHHQPLDRNDTIAIIDWDSPFSPASIDSLEVSSLINESGDLELLEEELLNGMDVSHLVNSLTEDEFNQLYNLLDDEKGSA
jgi:hypothetical protein